MTKEKNEAPKMQSTERPKLVFRFKDQDHQNLVNRAAELMGLSVNAWIVQETLKSARKQVRAEDQD